MSSKRYICCLCRPQYVNGRPTGPSVSIEANSPVNAAFQLLAKNEWSEPGYIEVIVYLDPDCGLPDAGRRWRLRLNLEPDRISAG